MGRDSGGRPKHSLLHFYKQAGFAKGGTQSQVNDGGGNDRHYCIDACGQGADLHQHLGDILRHSEEVGFVEVSHKRIGYDIESHAADG